MLVFLLVVPPSGGYFALYSAKWKIKVEGDTLTIHMPFRPVRIIKFQDITEVKERFIGIAGYIDGKKVFAADMRTSYYELFVEQLKEAGKMGPSFTVRPYQGNLVLAVLLLLVFGGSLVGVIFWPNETVDLFVYLGISGAFLASLYFLANSLFWKITVTQDTLFVKNTFGVEKAYPIGEISKVEERRENFTLYAGTEKIVKIGKNAAGLQSLLERLVEENVSYYDNGQLF
ncbi:MAG: hypothetical protein FWD39_04665 [Clostridiales bacterium]|nr:hypothetical protein [Clostridiales bacterium]